MSMKNSLKFPDKFIWGTSTAAAQIETASDHIWKGVPALDGSVLDQTIAHEQQRAEDVEYIARLGSMYRCGVDWARLQKSPNALFEAAVVEEYQTFFRALNDKGVDILFVLHHFSHPIWFEEKGGFANKKNIPLFLNYVEQCIKCFGPFVRNWNTFNEPNVFVMNGYILADFPPFKKNFFLANRVIKIIGQAHDQAFDLIKKTYPNHPIGISFNTAIFRGLNVLGKIAASFTHWWFNLHAAKPFIKCDYWGLSYYALILFDPNPLTEIDRPGELAAKGYPHDKMWAYYPQGLDHMIRFFYKKYRKPILITENGICSDDPRARIASMQDYLKHCHNILLDGIPLLGYIHWSTFDNFEWHLGNTFQFGLVSVDMKSMKRTWTAAASYYEELTKTNTLV
jgi:beta-glucosidase